MYTYPLLVKFSDGGSAEMCFATPAGRAQYFWGKYISVVFMV